MGNPKEMYLVRGPDGRMRTIMAFSVRGAAKEYLDRYPTKAGDEISVKLRSAGDWQHFQVT